MTSMNNKRENVVTGYATQMALSAYTMVFQVEVKLSILTHRPETIWSFQAHSSNWHYRSSFLLGENSTAIW
jgi:hypothetical protein